jgi:hypothetical protein
MRQQKNDELGDNADAPMPQQTIVYNDFSLELLVDRAAAGVQQQQEIDEADDNANMIPL